MNGFWWPRESLGISIVAIIVLRLFAILAGILLNKLFTLQRPFRDWNEWEHQSDWNATRTWWYSLWQQNKRKPLAEYQQQRHQHQHHEQQQEQPNTRLTAEFRWVRERKREKPTTWEGTMDGAEEVSERNLPPLDWGHVLTSLRTHTHTHTHWRITTRNKLMETSGQEKNINGLPGNNYGNSRWLPFLHEEEEQKYWLI